MNAAVVELLKALKEQSVETPVSFILETLHAQEPDPSHAMAELQTWFQSLDPNGQDFATWLIYETASYVSMGALELMMGVSTEDERPSDVTIEARHKTHGVADFSAEAPESVLVHFEELLAEDVSD